VVAPEVNQQQLKGKEIIYPSKKYGYSLKIPGVHYRAKLSDEAFARKGILMA
jgi:ribosomal protein L6P/L9E